MSAFAGFACSIARTLDVVGEWWSLLILRDLFAGMSRNDELQRDLGIASNVLAARLQTLRDAGLVERTPDPADSRCWCATSAAAPSRPRCPPARSAASRWRWKTCSSTPAPAAAPGRARR